MERRQMTTPNLQLAETYIHTHLPAGWKTNWHPVGSLGNQAGADSIHKILHIPLQENLECMAQKQPIHVVTLHELGHANCNHYPNVFLPHYKVIEQEIEAWEWAREHWEGLPEEFEDTGALSLYTYRSPSLMNNQTMPEMPDWEKAGFARIMTNYIQSL